MDIHHPIGTSLAKLNISKNRSNTRQDYDYVQVFTLPQKI